MKKETANLVTKVYPYGIALKSGSKFKYNCEESRPDVVVIKDGCNTATLEEFEKIVIPKENIDYYIEY